MRLCIGDKITVCEEDHEKSYSVEEITEDYIKLTNKAERETGSMHVYSADEEDKRLLTRQVVNRLHQVEDISYQKAVKILGILMDADDEI